jgi:hypothetical protein
MSPFWIAWDATNNNHKVMTRTPAHVPYYMRVAQFQSCARSLRAPYMRLRAPFYVRRFRRSGRAPGRAPRDGALENDVRDAHA